MRPKTYCTIPNCGKINAARGLCKRHYRQAQVSGKLPPKENKTDIGKMLKDHTREEGDCLVWCGAMQTTGYGMKRINGKVHMAHRLSWEYHNGAIPSGYVIDHMCFNRACVKPSHLRVATRGQNCSYRKGAPKNSTTGHRNVYARNDGTYSVVVVKEGEKYGMQGFQTLERATSYAKKLREIVFKEFAGNG